MADLSPDEALLRDCLAAGLLVQLTPRQIRNWLSDPALLPDYRDDMRHRLNQMREEHRQALGQAANPASEE